jgi:hypothetical protein
LVNNKDRAQLHPLARTAATRTPSSWQHQRFVEDSRWLVADDTGIAGKQSPIDTPDHPAMIAGLACVAFIHPSFTEIRDPFNP